MGVGGYGCRVGWLERCDAVGWVWVGLVGFGSEMWSSVDFIFIDMKVLLSVSNLDHAAIWLLHYLCILIFSLTNTILCQSG